MWRAAYGREAGIHAQGEIPSLSALHWLPLDGLVSESEFGHGLPGHKTGFEVNDKSFRYLPKK